MSRVGELVNPNLQLSKSPAHEFSDWYRGRRAVVIGGLGYIGSNLSAALLECGANVTIVTPARDRHRGSAADFERRGALVVEADAREIPAMRDVVRRQDVVFNVSGQSGAVQSVLDPVVDLDVNCVGGLAVLEALRLEKAAAKVVFASSRLVYGAVRALPVTENHAVAPLCPHGAHKAMVEQSVAISG